MSLLDIVRAGIAIADKVTKAGDLQATVKHEAFASQTTKGDRVYAPAVFRPALLVFDNISVISPTGELSFSRAQITILDATVIVTDDDRFTLPDGTTGPIVGRKGYVDKRTGQPTLTQILLG